MSFIAVQNVSCFRDVLHHKGTETRQKVDVLMKYTYYAFIHTFKYFFLFPKRKWVCHLKFNMMCRYFNILYTPLVVASSSSYFFIIAYDVCCCCYTQYTSDDNDAMLLIIIEISWMNNIFHEYQLPKSTTFQFIYFMQCFLYSESALNKLLFLCSFVYLYVSPYF